MASIVTIAPEIESIFSSSGIAVISLDFSSTATWPSSRWLAVAQAWTMCKADFPLARSKERRRVLPSMAMT